MTLTSTTAVTIQTSCRPLTRPWYVCHCLHAPAELLSVALLLLGEVICCAAHELHALQKAQSTGESTTTRVLQHHS